MNPNGFGSFAPSGCEPDTVNGAKFVRDLYEMSNDTKHKYSVPVLWDKKNKCIVSNESSEIVRMFTKEFDEWATGDFLVTAMRKTLLRLITIPDSNNCNIDVLQAQIRTWTCTLSPSALRSMR